MKKLIVNADDFGLTPSVNYGIIECFNNGIVSSATLMVNQPFALHACNLAHQNPELGVGIHLTFDKGRALTGVSSLTDSRGVFLSASDLMTTGLKKDFILEIRAQIEHFNKIMKRPPTHADSHHHIHIRNPKAHEAFIEVAQELSLKYRSDDNFIREFYDEGVTKANLLNIVEDKFSEGFDIAELMCHPAYIDRYLEETTSYLLPRRRELEILTSEEMKVYIEENYTLATF